MTKVFRFMASSDFDTLKNDAEGTATIVVPANGVVAAGATAAYTTTVPIGAPESFLVVSYSNSVNHPGGSYAILTAPIRHDRTGSAPYSIVVRFGHSGGNNIQFVCNIFNNGATPLTLSSTEDVFTFRIKSIKLPRFT